MQNKFYLKKKSLSSILQLEKDAEKNSNFHNFRKFRAVRENRTYAMLKSVFSSIHTRNLKKKFGAVFEKILKIPGGASYKVPPNFEESFSKSQSFDQNQIDRGISILEEIVRMVQALAVFTDGQTDVFLSIGFSVSRTQKTGFLATPRVRGFFS